jgi:hypothetical protein
VVWQLKGNTEEEKQQAFAGLKPALEALVGVVPGLVSLRVDYSTGPNPQNWDMCLVSEHDSWEALGDYATHPAHLAVASLVGAATTARAGADYVV